MSIQVFDGNGCAFPEVHRIACDALEHRGPSDDPSEHLEWFQITGPMDQSAKRLASMEAESCYTLDILSNDGKVMRVLDQRLKGKQHYKKNEKSVEHWSLWFYPKGTA
jgi:hypothetical protein